LCIRPFSPGEKVATSAALSPDEGFFAYFNFRV
jgi:hypothetical protein